MDVTETKIKGGALRGLAPGFPERLNAAMLAKGVDVPQLAKTVGCTRAVLSNYLRGINKTIDGVLALKIVQALDVAGQWLLLGTGEMNRHAHITVDESAVLAVYRSFKDEAARDMWLQQGKMLAGLARS